MFFSIAYFIITNKIGINFVSQALYMAKDERGVIKVYTLKMDKIYSFGFVQNFLK
jgi:hypothetical protein